MKYTELTQEQKESMTPILKKWFEYRNLWELLTSNWKHFNNKTKAYQQAQKAEIDYLTPMSYSGSSYVINRIVKLKFESELE